jgi:TRAP-type C4-dicarboxylate transport system substrate-binding protein
MNNCKARNLFLSAFVVAVFYAIPAIAADNTSAKILRMNVPVNLDSQIGHFGELFANKIKELSGGRYVVELFPNEQLAGGGGGNEAVQMAQQGLTDFDIHFGTMWQVYEPKLDVVSSPFLFRSQESVEAAKSKGLINYLKKLYRDSCGMQALAFGEAGYSVWFGRTKFYKDPSELRGVKMRSPNNSYTVAFSQWGANPSYATSNEVVTSLQQGVLDAAPYQLVFAYPQRMAEVAPFVTDCHFVFDFLTMTTNVALFDSLPEEDQKIIEEAGKYAETEFNKYMTGQFDLMKKNMIEQQGAKFYTLNEDEEKAYFEALKPLYQKKVETLKCDDLFIICGLDLEWAK